MEKLLELLKTFNNQITADMEKRLVTDGVIDSVDIVSLIAELEDTFHISIPMEEVVEANFDSIGAMWNMIKRLQKK